MQRVLYGSAVYIIQSVKTNLNGNCFFFFFEILLFIIKYFMLHTNHIIINFAKIHT